ncbi:hypothetical protein [Yoonia sp. MH D7]
MIARTLKRRPSENNGYGKADLGMVATHIGQLLRPDGMFEEKDTLRGLIDRIVLQPSEPNGKLVFSRLRFSDQQSAKPDLRPHNTLEINAPTSPSVTEGRAVSASIAKGKEFPRPSFFCVD